jgi:hypothetical protein
MTDRTVPVTYVGPFDEVEIAGTTLLCRRGQTVEVPAEIAGKEPTGEPGTKRYQPGEGLLAQPDNWQPGAKTRTTSNEK